MWFKANEQRSDLREKNLGIFLSPESNQCSAPIPSHHVPVPDTLGLENVAALEATLFWIPRGVQQPKAVGGDRIEEILALLSYPGNQIFRAKVSGSPLCVASASHFDLPQ